MNSRVRLALAAAVTLLLLEPVARVLGATPWERAESVATVEPEPLLAPDERWGFGLRDGRFTLDLGGAVTHATHERGARVVPSEGRGIVRLHAYGCSLTYGYGVEDGETWPAQLAALRPELEVHDHAVPGWGLAQVEQRVLYDLRRQPQPEIVLVGYAAFQDERTVLLRHWRRTLATFSDTSGLPRVAVPVVRGRLGALQRSQRQLAWQPWPLAERSAMAHLLERAWERAEAFAIDPPEVALRVLVALHERVSEAGARMVVVVLADDLESERRRRELAAQGVEVIDARLDLFDPRWSFVPVDPHPRPVAHAQWAEIVAAAL